MLVKLLRNGVGGLVQVGDLLTRPAKMKRTAEAQQEINEACKQLALYQLPRCPFCIKVRRTIHKLNLPIEKRNVYPGSVHREELQAGGGRVKSPCLRIEENGETRWMYESNDIIAYLQQRFGEA
ncbi:glutathione S-transferase N-terminal domain-containing protein [Oceanimonas pelagia]|uniref:Glutathione S-transferase N-terminal domain-containing protein n=1 Tax=Oceanimonas pelagia TaxID=3028314 RepID=A0AA50KRR8_9GAMM|nr:glutathione S-transferase N-terminal domain-containing protein [Oceanimonas pelagia]WMC12048.1 glutathione S-transferase N-terminal domain-containing protein [Oceanimonas pelagia]